jgi:tetratricopeptide (TPR) repeat protein
LSLALLACLAYQSNRSASLLTANRTLLEAESLGIAILQSGSGDRRLVEQSLERLRLAVAKAPFDSRIPLAAGSLSLLEGDRAAAVDWYRRALDTEARPEIYFNLGRALWLLAETDEALDAFRAAVRLDPSRRSAVPAELQARL